MRVGVLEEGGDAGLETVGAGGDENAELAQQLADGVDASGAPGQPAGFRWAKKHVNRDLDRH